MGIPCTQRCLVLRHMVHEVLDELFRSGRYTRAQAYDTLAKLVGLESEMAHVSRLGQRACIRAIDRLIEFKDREKREWQMGKGKQV